MCQNSNLIADSKTLDCDKISVDIGEILKVANSFPNVRQSTRLAKSLTNSVYWTISSKDVNKV